MDLKCARLLQEEHVFTTMIHLCETQFAWELGIYHGIVHFFNMLRSLGIKQKHGCVFAALGDPNWKESKLFRHINLRVLASLSTNEESMGWSMNSWMTSVSGLEAASLSVSSSSVSEAAASKPQVL